MCVVPLNILLDLINYIIERFGFKVDGFLSYSKLNKLLRLANNYGEEVGSCGVRDKIKEYHDLSLSSMDVVKGGLRINSTYI
jgi:hypothetical protein